MIALLRVSKANVWRKTHESRNFSLTDRLDNQFRPPNGHAVRSRNLVIDIAADRPCTPENSVSRQIPFGWLLFAWVYAILNFWEVTVEAFCSGLLHDGILSEYFPALGKRVSSVPILRQEPYIYPSQRPSSHTLHGLPTVTPFLSILLVILDNPSRNNRNNTQSIHCVLKDEHGLS